MRAFKLPQHQNVPGLRNYPLLHLLETKPALSPTNKGWAHPSEPEVKAAMSECISCCKNSILNSQFQFPVRVWCRTGKKLPAEDPGFRNGVVQQEIQLGSDLKNKEIREMWGLKNPSSKMWVSIRVLKSMLRKHYVFQELSGKKNQMHSYDLMWFRTFKKRKLCHFWFICVEKCSPLSVGWSWFTLKAAAKLRAGMWKQKWEIWTAKKPESKKKKSSEELLQEWNSRKFFLFHCWL